MTPTPMDPMAPLTTDPAIVPSSPDTSSFESSPANEPAVDPELQQVALDRLMAVAGKDYDSDKMAALKAKLAKFAPPSEKQTLSGSEDVSDAHIGAPQGAQKTRTGRDVEWSDYDLDFNVAHLYPAAVYRETPQGPKWVAMISDFWSTTRDFKNHDKTVNVLNSTEKEPLNLGEYLNNMVNGRELWKIAAVMPANSGQCGVLLERQVPIILPDPLLLKTTEEVAVPTNQDLKATEDAALAFMSENGLDSGAAAGDDTTSTDTVKEIGLHAIERGSAEHEEALAQLDDDGAVTERRSSNIRKAIDLNRENTIPAPVAKGIQDEAIENPIIGGAPNAAAGYSAAADLLRALNDPAYRASLPTEG